MKATTKQNNEKNFKSTYQDIPIKETENYFYKICHFGELRLWKKSGRITKTDKLTSTLLKEYEIFKNGTHHATIKAKTINDARAKVFNWYGKNLKVYRK